MKKQRGLRVTALVGMIGFLGLLGVSAAQCQTTIATLAPVPTPVTPSDIDRAQSQQNARALGMGGSDLIITGDVSDAAANPASIAGAYRYSQANTIVGTSSNIHVDKINDLSKGLKDLGNQFNSGNGSLAGVRGAFQKVYNFATDAGASDTSGRPANLSASVVPLTGFSVQNVGLIVYGNLAAKVRLQPTAIPIPGLSGPTGRLTAAYGVLGLTNIAVPFSVPIKVGTLGISPRITEASYAGAGFLVDETDTSNGFDTTVSPTTPNGNISGATYKEVHQQRFDVDLGYTSIPDPIYHIRGAVVVRNLLSPSFHLPRVVNSSLGAVPTGSDFSFRMKPQIDVGMLAPYNGVTYAAEIHNLNSVNGGKDTIHLGVEYPVNKAFILRGGYNNNRFVAGIGLAVSGVRLDVATGTNPQEQVALSLSFIGR